MSLVEGNYIGGPMDQKKEEHNVGSVSLVEEKSQLRTYGPKEGEHKMGPVGLFDA